MQVLSIHLINDRKIFGRQSIMRVAPIRSHKDLAKFAIRSGKLTSLDEVPGLLARLDAEREKVVHHTILPGNSATNGHDPSQESVCVAHGTIHRPDSAHSGDPAHSASQASGSLALGASRPKRLRTSFVSASKP